MNSGSLLNTQHIVGAQKNFNPWRLTLGWLLPQETEPYPLPPLASLAASVLLSVSINLSTEGTSYK